MEVIERRIPNSNENRFIELKKNGIIFLFAVFADDPGVDYYILKCIYLKMTWEIILKPRFK